MSPFVFAFSLLCFLLCVGFHPVLSGAVVVLKQMPPHQAFDPNVFLNGHGPGLHGSLFRCAQLVPASV